LRYFAVPLLAVAGVMIAPGETFNTKPKPQSMGQAIQYEKQKEAAAQREARKTRDPYDSVSNADRSADRTDTGVSTAPDRGENTGSEHRKMHRKRMNNSTTSNSTTQQQ